MHLKVIDMETDETIKLASIGADKTGRAQIVRLWEEDKHLSALHMHNNPDLRLNSS